MTDSPSHDPTESEFTEEEDGLVSKSRSKKSKIELRKSQVSRIILDNTDSFVIEAQDAPPVPRRSMAEIRKMSMNPRVPSIQEKLRRKSEAWLHMRDEEKGETDGENKDDDDLDRKLLGTDDDGQDVSTEIHPSILSKTYKDVTKHVYIRDEITGEDIFWGREYFGEDYEFLGEGDSYLRHGHHHRGTFGGDLLGQGSAIRRGASFASSSIALRELMHERVSEIYRKMEIKTFGQLLEAKAVRPKRLDAYCLGRGIMEKPIEVVVPTLRVKPKMREETIDDIDTFFRRIQEIEEENVNDEQIVCVFTANFVRTKKTWNEDCNMSKAVDINTKF